MAVAVASCVTLALFYSSQPFNRALIRACSLVDEKRLVDYIQE